MSPEKLVAKLDGVVTDIDNALDELMDLDSVEADKARTILMYATSHLNALIDDLTEDDEPSLPVSGAV